MRNVFSFAFMGALGLAAAVGASGLGSGTLISFNDFGFSETVSEKGAAGLNFDSSGASFVDDGTPSGGPAEVAVRVPAQLVGFDDALPSESILAPPLFFALVADSVPFFELVSVDLSGSLFQVPGAAIGVAGTRLGGQSFFNEVPLGFAPGIFTAASLGVSGPLTRLGLGPITPVDSINALGTGGTFGTGGQGGESPLTASLFDAPPPEADLIIDDIAIQTPSQVALPASGLLLLGALAGAAAFKRRARRA